MYVSRINQAYRPTQLTAQSAKKNQNNTNSPSFQRTRYKAAFAKYFDGPGKKLPNELVFKELMTCAQNMSGSVVDDIAKVFFKPEDYKQIMEGFRNNKEVYSSLNTASYSSPVWLVKNNNKILVSIFNNGYSGNWLDAITFNLKEDTRICFHGIDEYENYVLCLGKKHDGKDTHVICRDGIATLIYALKVRNL